MTSQDEPEEQVGSRQAFVAMRFFLEQFYARAGNDMETLIADITFEGDGDPLDPAAWEDWMACIAKARVATISAA